MVTIVNSLRETVLIVEDEYEVRQAVGTRLSLMGYCILATSNGEEALSIFKKESLSLVICVTRCSKTNFW